MKSETMDYKVFAKDEGCNALIIGETKGIVDAEAVPLKYMKELEEKQHNKDCYIWIEEVSCVQQVLNEIEVEEDEI